MLIFRRMHGVRGTRSLLAAGGMASTREGHVCEGRPGPTAGHRDREQGLSGFPTGRAGVYAAQGCTVSGRYRTPLRLCWRWFDRDAQVPNRSAILTSQDTQTGLLILHFQTSLRTTEKNTMNVRTAATAHTHTHILLSTDMRTTPSTRKTCGRQLSGM